MRVQPSKTLCATRVALLAVVLAALSQPVRKISRLCPDWPVSTRVGASATEGYGDAHRCHAGVEVAVVQDVGEAVHPAPIGRRRIGEGAVPIGKQHTVGGLAPKRRDQRVAFGIAVVAQHRK